MHDVYRCGVQNANGHKSVKRGRRTKTGAFIPATDDEATNPTVMIGRDLNLIQVVTSVSEPSTCHSSKSFWGAGSRVLTG